MGSFGSEADISLGFFVGSWWVVVVVAVVVGRQCVSDPTKNRSRQGLMFPCVLHSTADRGQDEKCCSRNKTRRCRYFTGFHGGLSFGLCGSRQRWWCWWQASLPYLSYHADSKPNTGMVSCKLNPTNGKYKQIIKPTSIFIKICSLSP